MNNEDYLFVQVISYVGLIYTWSGFSKIFSARRLTNLLKAIGLPPFLSNVAVGRLLGVLEVSLSAFLFASTGEVRSLVIVLVLILSVSFALISFYASRIGQELECGCFGDDRKIGVSTIILNVLIALASVFLLSGERSLPSALELSLQLGGWTSVWLIVGAALLTAYLWPALKSKSESAVGAGSATLYSAEAVTPYGRTLSITELYSGKPVLLVFAKRSCLECRPVLEYLQDISTQNDIPKNLFVVTRSSGQEIFDFYPGILRNTLFGPSSLSAFLGISMAPAAVVIGFDSSIESQPVYGKENVISAIGEFVNKKR